jgi:uncharacterized protein
MVNAAPVRVDPYRLCEAGREFAGKVPISALTRLASMLLAVDGALSYRVRFFRDEAKRMRVAGTVSAVLTMQCQRCLEPLRVTLDHEFSLQLVPSEGTAARVEGQLDPLLLAPGEPLDVFAMLEDEVMLALPLVPRHREVCAQLVPAAEPAAGEGEQDNPFRQLGAWQDHSSSD